MPRKLYVHVQRADPFEVEPEGKTDEELERQARAIVAEGCRARLEDDGFVIHAVQKVEVLDPNPTVRVIRKIIDPET